MLIDDSTNQQNMLREWANPLPPVEPSFNAWSFAKAGGKATVAGALNYFGSVRDFSSNVDQVHAGEVAAREKRLGLPASQPYIIPGGGEFRRKADSFMPDPETASQADHVIAGLSSGLTQAVGSVLTLGPAAGATVFGLTQGDDAYQRMLEKNPNIDKAAALKVAAVTGVAAGAGVLIPMAGATVAKTLGLVAAGGPGLFATQEALSRNILQQAGATAEAAQHDPTDPLGLALSLAIPGVFGGLHIRSLAKDNAARLAATVKQIESGGNRFGADGQLLTSPKGAQGEMQVMPGTATDPGYGVRPAADSSPDELSRVGRHYLAAMSHKYGDNDKALAAYNAGPGAVDAAVKAHGADWLAHMPGETQKYVAKANKLMGDHGAEVMAKDPATVDAARVKVGESVLHDALPEVGGAREAVMRAADLVGEGDIAGAQNAGVWVSARRSASDQVAADSAPADSMVGTLSTREVPVQSITLSKDVPQFKSDANAAGVVEPLGGSFDRTGVAPIQLWERNDGRLEVISGRHRLDLAQRSGEKTIPAQVHREADGFDARRASVLDAELNIRDGQGKVRDYVDYFHATRLDRSTAEQRGLLARSIGKRSFAIANDGSPELIAAHRAGKLSDEAAVAIAGAAPGDGRLQSVGIRAVQDGKTIAQAANTVRAVKLMAGDHADTTADMFGFDDSAMREAEQMAKIATAKQREIQTRLSAITGAAKRPELAKAEGINVKDAGAVLRRIEELRTESAAWDNWPTNPTLLESIRAEIHPDGAPLLQMHSAADLEAKTAREGNAAALDDRAQIDREAGHFQLQSQIEESRADMTGDMFGIEAPPMKATEPGTISAFDTASLKTLADEQPDMRVTLPGHDEPMRLADALEAAKKEADLIRTDAELVRAAVACALQNGAAIGAAA